MNVKPQQVEEVGKEMAISPGKFSAGGKKETVKNLKEDIFKDRRDF